MGMGGGRPISLAPDPRSASHMRDGIEVIIGGHALKNAVININSEFPQLHAAYNKQRKTDADFIGLIYKDVWEFNIMAVSDGRFWWECPYLDIGGYTASPLEAAKTIASFVKKPTSEWWRDKNTPHDPFSARAEIGK